MSEFIISLKPQYLDLMLSGEKTVELRNRPMYLPEGSGVWIYGALPVGAIRAYAVVRSVLHLSRTRAWEEYGTYIAIPRSKYRAYVAGADRVSVVVWDEVMWLKDEFSLSDIRESDPYFRPPQFYSQFRPPAKLKRRRAKK